MSKQLRCQSCGKFLNSKASEGFCYCETCGDYKMAISDLEEENQYLRIMIRAVQQNKRNELVGTMTALSIYVSIMILLLLYYLD